MEKQTNKLTTVFMAIIALTGWLALALQLYITVQSRIANDLSITGGLFNFLSYFTILTNMLIAFGLTVCVLNPSSGMGNFFSAPSTQSGMVVYIVVVAVVYNIVLKDLWNPKDLQLIADIILHYAIPVAYVLYWFGFVKKGSLSWSHPFKWLIYPLFYILYVLIRGAVIGRFPYPFLDVSQLGIERVSTSILVMTGAFMGLGLLLLFLDGLMSEQPKKKRRRKL